MSKRFERNVIKFLELLHYSEEIGTTGKFKKKYCKSKSEYDHLIEYLNRNELIIKGKYDGVNLFKLTDKGIEFLLERKKEIHQEEFNKMVAFTGTIIALIGIYTFIKDNFFLSGGILNVINVVFLLLFLFCIFPLTKFIFDYYFT